MAAALGPTWAPTVLPTGLSPRRTPGSMSRASSAKGRKGLARRCIPATPAGQVDAAVLVDLIEDRGKAALAAPGLAEELDLAADQADDGLDAQQGAGEGDGLGTGGRLCRYPGCPPGRRCAALALPGRSPRPARPGSGPPGAAAAPVHQQAQAQDGGVRVDTATPAPPQASWRSRRSGGCLRAWRRWSGRAPGPRRRGFPERPAQTGGAWAGWWGSSSDAASLS